MPYKSAHLRPCGKATLGDSVRDRSHKICLHKSLREPQPCNNSIKDQQTCQPYPTISACLSNLGQTTIRTATNKRSKPNKSSHWASQEYIASLARGN